MEFEYQNLVIELVHFVSQTNGDDKGLSLKEVKDFLNHTVEHKNGKTVLQCLKEEGRSFLNELIVFINELEN